MSMQIESQTTFTVELFQEEADTLFAMLQQLEPRIEEFIEQHHPILDGRHARVLQELKGRLQERLIIAEDEL
jgi:hypothetical protein